MGVDKTNRACGKKRLKRLSAKHHIPEGEIRAMARFDPTDTNKFLDWIVEQVAGGEISLPHDGSAVMAALNDFRRKGKLTGTPDIGKWTFAELREKLSVTESKGETARATAAAGQRVALDMSHWKVIEITTPTAADKLCRPEWCIKDPKHWKTYSCGSDNPAYLVLRDGEKYACIVPHKGELKNVKDKPLKPTKMFASILRKLMPQMSVAWMSDFLGFEHLLRPIGEIAANPESAYRHARFVIEGRWPDGEPAIAAYPKWACHYAMDIVGDRWPEGEAAIATDPEWANQYALDVVGRRWPEGECRIANSPMQAYYYACGVVKGRWPEAEPAIAKLPPWYHEQYAAISGYPGWADRYTSATRTPQTDTPSQNQP